METINVSTLQIHKLSKAQYERESSAGNLDEYALYLTPDEEIDMSLYATIERLNTKADTDHNHNDIYYTENEVDTKLANKADIDHSHSDIQETIDTLNATNKPITTSGDGSAYTATVSGITALTAGASFIMIPHVASTSTQPTLDVNGLGAKYVRRRLSTLTGTLVAGNSTNWLTANKPIRMIYDGTYWIVDLVRPSASDIYGTVPISSGGTAATTAESARANLGAMADVPVTASDAGKFLRVSSDGVWVAEEVPDAESTSF